MLRRLAYSVLKACWRALRGLLELFIPRHRLDQALHSAGFFRFKSWFSRRQKTLPNGLVIVYRPDDEKVIDDVFLDRWYDRPTILPDDVVIDVGAHIGTFTLLAAAKNPKGRVLAIEPSSDSLRLLRRNIALNSLSHVRVFPCAVSDRPGRSRLIFVGNYSMYALSEVAPERDAAGEDVAVRTVDDIAAEAGVSSCGVMKIDVEGAEWDVLRGAARTLAATRQVIAEISKAGGLPERVTAMLSGLGFTCSTELETEGVVLLYAVRR